MRRKETKQDHRRRLTQKHWNALKPKEEQPKHLRSPRPRNNQGSSEEVLALKQPAKEKHKEELRIEPQGGYVLWQVSWEARKCSQL
jgi:hypothetical protein